MTHQSQYSFEWKNPDVATDPNIKVGTVATRIRDGCNILNIH